MFWCNLFTKRYNLPVAFVKLATWNNFTGSLAPSNVLSDNNVIEVVGASHGYIVTMSDFIDFGEGVGFHNYVHAESEATLNTNLILYGKEFGTIKE